MSALVPYHFGVVVDDMDAAIGGFSDSLGYVFNEPRRLHLHDLDDRLAGVTGPTELFVTYSRTGPLRIELIECTGSGLYSSDRVGGVHHIGVWDPDPERRLAEIEAAGRPVDAVLRGADGSLSVFYAGPSAVQGVRVEYVNEAQRERLERWFETGELS